MGISTKYTKEAKQMTENQSIKFAKESHIALNDPRWEWTGSTAFLGVWCWLPIVKIGYTDPVGDFFANVRIGCRNIGQRMRFFITISSYTDTGQCGAKFHIATSSCDDPSLPLTADLNVDTESVSMDDLLKSAEIAGDKLLFSERQQLN